MTEVSKLLLSLKPGQTVFRTGKIESFSPDLHLTSMTDQTNPSIINPIALQSWTHPFKEHDPMIYYGEGEAKLFALQYGEFSEKHIEGTFVFLRYFNNATYQFTFSKSSLYAENFHELFYIL